MAALLAEGRVAWDYALGWDRSVAEVFAEDYKVTNLPGEASKIGWLGPPTAAVSDAIRADLGGAVVAPVPPPQTALRPPPAAGTEPPQARVRLAAAGGRLRAGGRARVRFGVAAAGRIAVTVSGVTAGRVRAVLSCDGATLAGAAARPGAPVTLRARRTARGACRVGLRAIGSSTRYRVVAAASPIG